jgi:hypothetical protein
LRLHGLVCKVGRTYTYDLTAFAQRVLTTVLPWRELVVRPPLQAAPARV